MTTEQLISPKRAMITLISSLALAAALPVQASGYEHGAGRTADERAGTSAPPGRTAEHPGRTMDETARTDRADDIEDAVSHMTEAQRVVKQMESDPELRALMQQAKGIYIVPDYGRAAAVVGAQGGAGVLLVRRDGQWTGPSFYNMGSVSVGAQAGVTAGSVAMLLMNDKAVNSFKQDNNFSLDANAGITIVDYSARAQGTAGKGDIVLWSDTEGAFLGASIAISDINFDEQETAALYRKPVTPSEIISGQAGTPPQARSLLKALPA